MADAAENPVILASGSRFRRRMLEQAGLDVRVEPAEIDEPALRQRLAENNPELTPAGVAACLASAKAEQVSRRHPAALVIGADQVLAFAGEIFGKSADRDAARAQILRLRGATHTLPTAVVLAVAGRTVWAYDATPALTMRNFSPEFLDAYLDRAGPVVLDICGGYQLERLGVQLFDRVEGDYFTVIGLPLLPLLAELRRRGVLDV